MTEKSMEITRARINAGGVELEVEGANLDVPNLIAQITEMRRTLGAIPAAAVRTGSAQIDGMGEGAASAGVQTMSTNTIASLMNASTGSDLVMAAMAHIILIQRKDYAARREILDEMRAAKTFYKDTFSGNLSSYLDNLAKAKRLNLVAKETYALPNAERQNFEHLIANAG